MGSQQVILIVTTTLIVGIAITIGITVFGQNLVKNNRQACIADMNNFAANSIAWWKTPDIMGGGSRMQYLHGGGSGHINYIDKLGNYLGYNYSETGNTLSTINGSYKILYGGSYSVKFVGTGTENYKDSPVKVNLTVNLQTTEINIDIIN